MEKIIKKIKKEEELQNNIKFWLDQSDEDRLSAVQILREQYISYFNKEIEYNESRKRLRRFYKIIKQT